jgi:hypothetical protein
LNLSGPPAERGLGDRKKESAIADAMALSFFVPFGNRLWLSQAAERGPDASETAEQRLAGAKALVGIATIAARLKSCPVTKHAKDSAMVSFSAACISGAALSGRCSTLIGLAIFM